MGDNKIVGTSSDGDPAVLGLGGLAVGVQGSPQDPSPSPLSFTGVLGITRPGISQGPINIGQGIGVRGVASGNSTGVQGESPGNIGVAGMGFVGVSGNGTTGVSGTGTEVGIEGTTLTPGQGLAGKFLGNVTISGSLEVDDPVKVGGSLTVNNQDLLQIIQGLSGQVQGLSAQVQQLSTEIQQVSAQIPIRTTRGVPIQGPPQPIPASLIPSHFGTSITINGKGFEPGQRITMHSTHTVPTHSEQDDFVTFPFTTGLEQGDHMTAVATDGTLNPNDTTGVLWSNTVTFDV